MGGIQTATSEKVKQFSAMNAGSLEGIFNPKTIAIVDMGDDGTLAERTREGLVASEFRGTHWMIGKRHTGSNSYPTLRDVPSRADLAVVVAPPELAPEVVEQCANADVKGVVLLSSGFGEQTDCNDMQTRMRAALAGSRTRVIGPHALGVLNPKIGLNVTPGLPMALGGTVAFLGESPTLSRFVLEWSLKQIVGFSAFACVGSMLDVTWANLIDYFGRDPFTRTIVIQMSSVGDARSLMSAAREVSLEKPIIVMKAGRDNAALRAAAWSSRCQASDDEILTAAFRRVGVLEVDTLEDLFYCADALSKQPRPAGPRLMVVSNADAPAMLAADSIARSGLEPAVPSEQTRAEVVKLLPANQSLEDVLGQGDGESFLKAVQVCTQDPNADGLLLLMVPSAFRDPQRTAELLLELQGMPKPLLISYMGVGDTAAAQETLARACIPAFSSPAAAARVFQYMWRYSYDLQALYETPVSSADRDHAAAHKNVSEKLRSIRASGRTSLSADESQQVLSAYGISFSDGSHISSAFSPGYRARLGSRIDPQFGPVLMFGSADRGTEVYGDRVIGFPPLNTTLARRMLQGSKFYEAIRTACEPVCIAALENLVVRFSEVVVEHPSIREVEVNPVVISKNGVAGLNSRCVLHDADVGHHDLPRPAIRPYPVKYQSSWTMKNGQAVTIRPIRAEDEPLMVKFHQGLSDRSVYLRYFQRVKLSTRTSHNRLVRVCFLDYDREIALLAEQRQAGSQEPGVVAIATLQKMLPKCDGEIAVLISDDYHGQGLGKELVARLVEFARDEGLRRVSATTMPENAGMCAVFRKLGFDVITDFEEQLVTAKLDLGKS